MNKVFIYGLVDPRTDEIRYIGCTRNIAKRYEKSYNMVYKVVKRKTWKHLH